MELVLSAQSLKLADIDPQVVMPLGWRVTPDSVVWSPQLSFVPLPSPAYETLLFECKQDVVPKWYGVAVARSVSLALNRVHLFFHPTPGQARAFPGGPSIYRDQDYFSFGGAWPGLRKYVHALGGQLAAAESQQVLVVPFLTEASRETVGVLAAQWQDIVMQIITLLRKIYGFGGPPRLDHLLVSSFSAGVKYTHSFLAHAPGTADKLRAIFDFDGQYSTYRALAAGLKAKNASVLRYDQTGYSGAATLAAEAERLRFHAPPQRWRSLFGGKLLTGGQIHSTIPRYLFYHALLHEQLVWHRG